MEVLWFCLVAFMLAAYVVLDGFDLGAGIIHLWAARKEEQRQLIMRSIGPVWDGNEVWLLAAGGTLYFVFPALYASSFSGFYLPLIIVLWLLMFRGLSLELRHHIDSPLWKPFWDVAFAGSSALLSFFFGAALGNVVRGVPLEPSGYFFLPLWTDLGWGPEGLHGSTPGILDWYTLLVGCLALSTLTLHGSRWIILKTEGEVRQRAEKTARLSWWITTPLLIAVTWASFRIQPQLPQSFADRPWGFLFPALALIGLMGCRAFGGSRAELVRFLASGLFIAGMLCSVAFGLFPLVLPANTDPSLGLTLFDAASSRYGLQVGLLWWIPGMILVIAYFVYTYRHFSGKVRLDGEGY